MSQDDKPLRGPTYPVTAAWADDANLAREKRSLSKRELTALLKEKHGEDFCSESGVGNALGRKYPTSHLVPAISKELGIGYSVSLGSDGRTEWNDIGMMLERYGLLEEYLARIKTAADLETKKRELFHTIPDNSKD